MAAGEIQVEHQVAEFQAEFSKLRNEVGQMIVGHEDIVEGVLVCLFAGGHALLEGVPGLEKTLLIRTLSQALSLDFSRVQFHARPDAGGTSSVRTSSPRIPRPAGGTSSSNAAPLFAQMVLADEINRATPKTQSALLEAMQEHRVTVAGEKPRAQEPFS